MQIKNEIFQTLNVFKDIIDRAKVSHPITGVVDDSRTMMVFINTGVLQSEPFTEFGLIKTKEMLDLLTALSNPNLTGINIELDNGVFNLSTKSAHCQYLSTTIELLESSSVDSKMLDAVRAVTPIFDFVLSNPDLEKIKKISGLLNLETLILSNGKISVSSGVMGNNFSLDLEGTFVSDEHNVPVQVSCLKKLPAMSYRVRVLQHPTAKENYIVWLSPNDDKNDIINIIIAMKN